jgi:glutamate synthase domain-containing protein 1
MGSATLFRVFLIVFAPLKNPFKIPNRIMCGIVGLLIKKPEWRESLGELMVPMLIGMSDRGPDSAGLAIFTATLPEPHRKYSLYSGAKDFDWSGMAQAFQTHFNATPDIQIHGNQAVLTSDLAPDQIKQWLKTHYPQLHMLSTGRTIDLYKDTGKPAAVADRYNFKALKGSHAIAHTRMATESAVTPAHAHPVYSRAKTFASCITALFQSLFHSSSTGTAWHSL